MVLKSVRCNRAVDYDESSLCSDVFYRLLKIKGYISLCEMLDTTLLIQEDELSNKTESVESYSRTLSNHNP